MMLETIAKSRPEGRPAPAARAPKKDAPQADPAAQLQDVIASQQQQELREELLLQKQRDQYDFMTAERAELEREYDTTRDMVVEQLKQDDETLKKYISMI